LRAQFQESVLRDHTPRHRPCSGEVGGTGLNLRVAPNDGLSWLALAVLLAPPFDKAEVFHMFDQKGHQVVTLTTLHRTAIVIEGAKHHLHREAFQGFTQRLGDLLADRHQHRIEHQRRIELPPPPVTAAASV
jgi:hypothetical protein